jgi:hypothetical protein
MIDDAKEVLISAVELDTVLQIADKSLTEKSGNSCENMRTKQWPSVSRLYIKCLFREGRSGFLKTIPDDLISISHGVAPAGRNPK